MLPENNRTRIVNVLKLTDISSAYGETNMILIALYAFFENMDMINIIIINTAIK